MRVLATLAALVVLPALVLGDTQNPVPGCCIPEKNNRGQCHAPGANGKGIISDCITPCVADKEGLYGGCYQLDRRPQNKWSWEEAACGKNDKGLDLERNDRYCQRY